MTATRQDLASAVGILSRFISNHDVEHWQSVKRILWYLKGTLDYSLFFDKSCNEVVLSGYVLDSSKFIFRFPSFFLSCCVSWCSKQQSKVEKSSTEAEYIALSGACALVAYLMKLISNRNRLQFYLKTTAGQLSKNPKFHDGTKHIKVHFHPCRERDQNGDISVLHCSSDRIVADMTKALPRAVFRRIRLMMGLCQKDLILFLRRSVKGLVSIYTCNGMVLYFC